MDDSAFFELFVIGLSAGLGVGFVFLYVSRAIRKSFGLIGRAALMR